MFRFNDIFLVVVGGYVIYKIIYVDGFTTVNLLILLCLSVAVISTALRRSGKAPEMKEKKGAPRLKEEKDISFEKNDSSGNGEKNSKDQK